MAEIFISYSQQRSLTEQLVSDLEAHGFSVWWDAHLVAGEWFRDIIRQELDAAKAVIVIWTPESVQSHWVCWEADRAFRRDKLVPVRIVDVSVDSIPPPFGDMHTSLVENRSEIFTALSKLGLRPRGSPRPADRSSHPFTRREPHTSPTPSSSIRPQDRDNILEALAAGVVPRRGLHHLHVGQLQQVQALLQDIERVVDGRASIRFVIAEYGSEKAFFLNLIRQAAHERRLVTVHADLSVDRRLQATGGQARNLYTEAIRNMATRNRPDGGAMSSIVDRFLTAVIEDARLMGFDIEEQIQTRLATFRELVGGYDFADVIGLYWKARETADEALRTAALRWLRAEFSSQSDARAALGVRTIIDDASVYDHWKMWGHLVRLTGYSGLLVMFDELINVYKLNSPQARNSNYEQILRIFNDVHLANFEGVGFVFAGPLQFLTDVDRGLYSYPALRWRLAENQFASKKSIDMTSPVITLESMTPEQILVLLSKIRSVHAGGDSSRNLLPDRALRAFMAYSQRQVQDASFWTPRIIMKIFVQFLNSLEQDPGMNWETVLEQVKIEPDNLKE